MSKSILSIGLGVLAIGVAVFAPEILPLVGLAAGTLAGTAAIAAVEIGISLGGSLLMGSAKAPSLSDASTVGRLQASFVTTEPRKIVFGGTTALGNDVRYQAYSGADQEYLEMIIVHASHEVHSIDELWLDNEKAWSASGGVQGRYSGYLTVTTRTVGTSSNGIGIDGTWTSHCTLTGCAYTHLQFKLTGNDKKATSPFSSGVTSRMTWRGKGAKIYDPRLDSTVEGGSGSMRADDQTTWAWDANGSRNPALQELWYELGWKINGKLAVGKGVPPARLDLASYAVAANACDESIALAAGGTEPRYRSDAVVSEGDDPGAVRDNLCSTMNAVLRDAGGKLALTVIHDDLASPVTPYGKDAFDEDDILGDLTWEQTPDLSSTFNIVRGQMTDASDAGLYQQVDFPEVALASNDGIDRIDTIQLPFVQSNGQAQRIAKQRLQRAQYQGKLTFSGKPSFWGLSLGDVFPLSLQTFGWSKKLFRCAGQTISRTGETQIVAVEENAAIYAWDAEEAPAVVPGDPVVYDPLNSPLVAGISAAEAAAAAAEADAATAASDAAAAIAGLDDMADDGKLTPVEKRAAVNDYDELVSEQSDIDAKGTLYAITTEKTDYDNAVAALTTYLGTLTTPVAWNDRSNYTTIVGATWKSTWAEVYSTRQLLLNAIAAAAKALADIAALSAAPGDGNRVRFSLFERGTTGWANDSIGGATITLFDVVNYSSVDYVDVEGDFTAANQNVAVLNNSPAVGGDTAYQIPVTAGERVFVGALIGTAIPAGASWNLDAAFKDSTNADKGSFAVASGSASVASGTLVGDFLIVPAGSTYLSVELWVNSLTLTSGSFIARMGHVIVCSAGSEQTVWPAFTPGPSNLPTDNATSYSVDLLASYAFPYDYDTTQNYTTQNVVAHLKDQSGNNISAGITWKYTVVSGTVNGNAGDGGVAEYAMTVDSSAPDSPYIPVSSLGSNTNVVEVRAYQGLTIMWPKRAELDKDFAAAPPPSGGGSGSSTLSVSGGISTGLLSGDTNVVLLTLSGTTPTSVTSVSLAANVSLSDTSGSKGGSAGVSIQWQRLIGGTWTTVGSAGTGSCKDVLWEPQDGSIALHVTDSSLTGNTAYQWRLIGSHTSGTDVCSVSGSGSVTG